MKKHFDILVRMEMQEGAALITRAVGQRSLEAVAEKIAELQGDFLEEMRQGWQHEVWHLRAWALAHERKDQFERIIEVARQAREAFKVFVTLGIGGSDLAQRTIHDTLNDPSHNMLVADGRTDLGPEVYFAGNTFDPRRLVSLLDMLEQRELLTRTCFNVVSKSGKTAETISAMLMARDRLIEAHRGEARRARRKNDAEAWRQNIIATTGPDAEGSVLRRMHGQSPFFAILPIPDGVGGRFSVVSPVGLLFLGVTAQKETPAQRVKDAIEGLRIGHLMFQAKPSSGLNAAFDLAAWLHLAETRAHRNAIVFYNYSDTPCIGEWFLQLYTESVQERNGGLSVTAVTGPTGNHSILNGIVGGPRDRVAVVIAWDKLGAWQPKKIIIPTRTQIGGELEAFEGIPLDVAQQLSSAGTVADFTENGVPNVVLRVAERNTRSLFCLLRVLMDTVAVKGRMQNLNHAPDRKDSTGELTYLQDGVEGYKKKTIALAKAWKSGRRKR
ncbi:MAG: hypothetical protein NTX50_08060 [Candidatus Sumerlaeota bacterium]|nr:hypothetical protein [Candidatus Sumerlaeota bacterium]